SGEERRPHRPVRLGILEDAGAGERRTPYAGSREQLAPAAGRFRIGDVGGLAVEGDAPRAQARHGDEAGAVVQLEQDVPASLRAHAALLSVVEVSVQATGSIRARKSS